MSKKEQKSLEEIARNTREGIKLPEFIALNDFETKIKRIARKYGGEDTIHQKSSSHRDIRIAGARVGWSPRRRGDENVLSPGVFEETIEHVSEAIGIPYKQLELYFIGTGKPYKSYKRIFEREYSI